MFGMGTAGVRTLIVSVRAMPKVATIDFHVTSECNQECPYCWGPQGFEDPVDTDTARAIVNRVGTLGIQRIVFTGGDPLLRSDIGSLIDLARSSGLEVALSTTGDELSRGFLLDHRASIDLISLPLDGPSESVSSRTKKEGHFTAVMTALDLLVEFPEIDVKVATPVTQLNLGSVPDIVRLLEARCAATPNRFFYNVFQAYPRSMGETDWDALVVSDEEFSRLRDEVEPLNPSFRVNWLTHETLDRLYVMIFPDGRVTVPAGSRFETYGSFLDIDDIDAFLDRTEFESAKHVLHSKGWTKAPE
jgi:MoaA/NifB/PqqE/SkfB family radical SAM enzyme